MGAISRIMKKCGRARKQEPIEYCSSTATHSFVVRAPTYTPSVAASKTQLPGSRQSAGITSNGSSTYSRKRSYSGSSSSSSSSSSGSSSSGCSTVYEAKLSGSSAASSIFTASDDRGSDRMSICTDDSHDDQPSEAQSQTLSGRHPYQQGGIGLEPFHYSKEAIRRLIHIEDGNEYIPMAEAVAVPEGWEANPISQSSPVAPLVPLYPPPKKTFRDCLRDNTFLETPTLRTVVKYVVPEPDDDNEHSYHDINDLEEMRRFYN